MISASGSMDDTSRIARNGRKAYGISPQRMTQMSMSGTMGQVASPGNDGREVCRYRERSDEAISSQGKEMPNLGDLSGSRSHYCAACRAAPRAPTISGSSGTNKTESVSASINSIMQRFRATPPEKTSGPSDAILRTMERERLTTER